MATIPDDSRLITAAEMSLSDRRYVADMSASDPKDRCITNAEDIIFLSANGLIASALIDQPDGVAGLNEDGHIVGPIIVGIYANAAAAGVLPNGTLAKVGDTLCLGDGEATGGNVVTATETVSSPSPGSTIELNANNHACIHLAPNTFPAPVFTISNSSATSNSFAVGTELTISCLNSSATTDYFTVYLSDVGTTLVSGSMVAPGGRWLFRVKKISPTNWVYLQNAAPTIIEAG